MNKIITLIVLLAFSFQTQAINKIAIDKEIEIAAKRYSLDVNLIKAIVQVESHYDPNVISKKGAIGLMQLLPSTGEMMGAEDLFDIKQNLDAGCRYYKKQLDIYKDKRLALAAYNAGGGAVKRWRRIPPYPETRRYIRKVYAAYEKLTEDTNWFVNDITESTEEQVLN